MTKAPNSEQKLVTRDFLVLCLCSFLFMASFNMIIPELPDHLRSLGGGKHIGLIISIFTLSAMLSRPFSGKMADQMGRKSVMFIGVIISTLCCMVYPLFTTVYAFFVLRFLHGFSTGFQPTGITAYLADIVPRHRRGEAMGILGVSHSSGMAIGPFIGSGLANTFSTTAMFTMATFVSVLALLAIFLLKETLEKTRPFGLDMLVLKKGEIIEPRVLLPSFIMLLTVFPFGLVLTIIPDMSVHLGIANKGLYMSVFLVFSLLVRLVAGRASDKYGRENTVLVGTFFLIAALLLTGFANSTALFLSAAAIYGIGGGIISPTIFAWVADKALEEHRARAMATMFIGLEIGIMLGSLCSGYVYGNNAERFSLVFLIAASVAFTALAILLLVKRAAFIAKRK